jgi:hypothetical protein
VQENFMIHILIDKRISFPSLALAPVSAFGE